MAADVKLIVVTETDFLLVRLLFHVGAPEMIQFNQIS